jgi:eukaryotic-like serine/threonine-protein kinase
LETAAMRITLTVTEGPHQGQVFVFDGHDTFLVGRSKRAHFRLATKDRYFSRVHFLVEVNPPNCRLMDMSSSNGTHVNGKRVDRTDLHDGDLIRAGQTVLQVAVTADAPAPSGEHAVIPPTLIPQAPPAEHVGHSDPKPSSAPPLGRSAGHAVVKPSDPPIVGRSGSQAALRPPAPPATTAPATAKTPSTSNQCVACGGVLPSKPTNDMSLCPACEGQSQTQRQTITGYHLVRELGRGSMGLVYLAVRRADNRSVAVKTIIPAAAGTEAQVQRFLREAHILRELDHPNIVAFRDMGESSGMLYFAMDYIRGQDAHKLMKKQGRFEVRRAATLACQMLDALAFAHSHGFVHRDIKPSNLMIAEGDASERLMVADFGLAKVYQASNLSGLTMTGDVGGTIPFMAPEQITEYRLAKPPVDQYSAAASLYNMLTGSYVYDFPSSFQNQLLTILNESPVPVRKRRPDLPEALAAIIDRGLKREPVDRFPDAAAMRDALKKFVG